jgi:hypothetical protein
MACGVLHLVRVVDGETTGIGWPDAIADPDNSYGQRHATLRLSINLEEPFWRYDCVAPMTLHA